MGVCYGKFILSIVILFVSSCDSKKTVFSEKETLNKNLNGETKSESDKNIDTTPLASNVKSDTTYTVQERNNLDHIGKDVGFDGIKKARNTLKKDAIDTLKIHFLSKMVFIKGGSFLMGCTDEQKGDCLVPEETPVHQVNLSSFMICKYEVSWEDWHMVMGGNMPEKCSECPVSNVSWYQVNNFINNLNNLTDIVFRLPTEAEWEYSARGGQKTNRFKYSGSNDIDEVSWYEGNSEGRVHPVGQKKPNELLLYDMSGNVWEWCSDWAINGYDHGTVTNPIGHISGKYKEMRGGAYTLRADHHRVANRGASLPRSKKKYIGFRLASSNVKLQ